jgi:hypothetical protein
MSDKSPSRWLPRDGRSRRTVETTIPIALNL